MFFFYYQFHQPHYALLDRGLVSAPWLSSYHHHMQLTLVPILHFIKTLAIISVFAYKRVCVMAELRSLIPRCCCCRRRPFRSENNLNQGEPSFVDPYQQLNELFRLLEREGNLLCREIDVSPPFHSILSIVFLHYRSTCR